ncbi:MAG TPA: twin-arginine translocase TatA/TatE family subunit [Planctomycetota bacterium]|nr:twin-arginine translocase TatA/TatE family subunit [Planctomycetota bacterium]
MPQMLAVLSATHVVLVVVVVLLLFGAQKIPELARSLGSGLNEFKKGMREGEQALLRESETPTPAAPPAKETTTSPK